MSAKEKKGFFRRNGKLLGFAAFGLAVFLLSPKSDGMKKWVSDRFKPVSKSQSGKTTGKETASEPISVDISTNFFARFQTALSAEAPIRISIRSTQFDIETRWTGRTTAEFVIRARSESDYRRFNDRIEELVFSKGLECYADATKQKRSPKLLYNAKKHSIDPGTDFRGWIVRLEDIHPAGVIELTFEDAHKDLFVEMPEQVPLWSVSYGFSLDHKEKRLVIRNKEKDRSAWAGEGGVLLRPGVVSRNGEQKAVAGYRVLRVFSYPGWTCAWLEVMYDDSPTRIRRDANKWPGVDISVTRPLEGRNGSLGPVRKVRFKDEKEELGETENNIGQFFDDQNRPEEILQVDRIFNSRAVSFKLYDRDSDWIADLLVLCEIH